MSRDADASRSLRLSRQRLTVAGRWAGLALDVTDRRRPEVGVEAAPPRMLRVRAGDRVLIWGWVGAERYGVHWHRPDDAWRSPLPPLRARDVATGPDPAARLEQWAHRFCDVLQIAPGPLWDGRWEVRPVHVIGAASGDRPQEHALAYLDRELLDAGSTGFVDWGGNGSLDLLPLRRLSAPSAPRVKAHRRRAREATLAPVLLWWVGGCDCWAVLDGHDRLLAALLEALPLQALGLVEARTEDSAPRTRAFVAPEGEAGWRRELLTVAPGWAPWEQ